MFKIFKRMQRVERLLMLASVLLVIAQVYSDLKIPEYMTTITRLVKTPGSALSDIYAAGGMMLAFAVLGSLLTLCSDYVGAQLAGIFSMHLREDVFNKVEAFSPAEIDRFSTASLITRSTNDVRQIQMFISRGLTMTIRMPITVVMALIKITGRHWEWTAITGGAVVIILFMVYRVITYAHPRFRKMQSLTDDLNRVTRENLTGIRVVRAYNAEEYQMNKFKEANDRLTNNGTEARLATNIMHPTMRFVNNALTVCIYLAGAYIIARTVGSGDALTTFSDMVVFSNYASRILFAFMSLNMIFMQWPRASVSAERINEVLETEPSIVDGTEERGLAGMEGEVEFKNVSFRYPNAEQPVITGINFTAHKGEVVAFIGATGSGKSTIVNLVPRFYDATEGEVLINGINVKNYRLEALRDMIGYAPQRAVLFTGNVSSNVSYGKSAGEPEGEEAASSIREAVDIAQAKEFVEQMEGTYEADISRGGTNVSGGQKQRLSIARAIYRKPEIYIFDDTFSALDYKTDRTLRSRLKEETAGVTTLIVAQRIGTIRDADKILVLDDGVIVGTGTHEELLKNCEVYREIALTQLSEEELA